MLFLEVQVHVKETTTSASKNQTKLHFCLQLCDYKPSIATKIPCFMMIVIPSTLSIRMINNPSVFICFLRILFVTPSHVDNLLRGSEYLVLLKKGLHCITSVAHTWLHLKIVNYTQCNRNILHQCALQCIFIYTKYENVKSVNNLL